MTHHEIRVHDDVKVSESGTARKITRYVETNWPLFVVAGAVVLTPTVLGLFVSKWITFGCSIPLALSVGSSATEHESASRRKKRSTSEAR